MNLGRWLIYSAFHHIDIAFHRFQYIFFKKLYYSVSDGSQPKEDTMPKLAGLLIIGFIVLAVGCAKSPTGNDAEITKKGTTRGTGSTEYSFSLELVETNEMALLTWDDHLGEEEIASNMYYFVYYSISKPDYFLLMGYTSDSSMDITDIKKNYPDARFWVLKGYFGKIAEAYSPIYPVVRAVENQDIIDIIITTGLNPPGH